MTTSKVDEIGGKYWYSVGFRSGFRNGKIQYDYIDVLANDDDAAGAIATDSVKMPWGIHSTTYIGTRAEYEKHHTETFDSGQWTLDDVVQLTSINHLYG